jgi:hypothetical protein
MSEPIPQPDADPEELLRRALLEPGAAISLSLRIEGLSLADALTVVFHGRRDLGTIGTYIANGGRGEGDTVSRSELLRVPCDLDLADASDRDEAQERYAEQARTLRDALLAADTVLAIWREPLEQLVDGEVVIDRSVELGLDLPAHRLMPVALVAPERRLAVIPVCGSRTLAEGRPPLGIACAQQDVVHIYSLPDDPEACLDDFMQRAGEHARQTADRLELQARSVERFLELGGNEFQETG